jgi:nucleoside-diphosphate-sugar epimerase
MNILILGCGVIGSLTGKSLVSSGHQVMGVRRRARPEQSVDCPIITGDITDPALHVALAASMPRVDAVLIAANPGVRRGVDNGLAKAVPLVHHYHPQARVVYTGTTSVYGDASGRGVDETTVINRSEASVAALMAIEDAVLQQAEAVVLRATALVGPSRLFSRDKLREAEKANQPCRISGDLDRPFSYLHEYDLVELCQLALLGDLPPGLYNAAAPEVLSVRRYYEIIAKQHHITCSLVGDWKELPARWINAEKIYRVSSKPRWRSVVDDH